MRSLPTIKNITVAFSEDEYPLFEAFERLRQRDYQTRAGWIKSTIYKSLPEDERLNLFKNNEIIQVDTTTMKCLPRFQESTQ